MPDNDESPKHKQSSARQPNQHHQGSGDVHVFADEMQRRAHMLTLCQHQRQPAGHQFDCMRRQNYRMLALTDRTPTNIDHQYPWQTAGSSHREQPDCMQLAYNQLPPCQQILIDTAPHQRLHRLNLHNYPLQSDCMLASTVIQLPGHMQVQVDHQLPSSQP